MLIIIFNDTEIVCYCTYIGLDRKSNSSNYKDKTI